MKNRSAENSGQLSGINKVLFPILLVLVPVLFFVLFEASLRIAGYGKDYDLVHKIKIGDTDYYAVNKLVARRYFSPGNVTIPDARDGVFLCEKSPDIFRIFCMGGSTVAGFPFQYNATFPSLLTDRLERLFPDKHFEVINFGISAINSFSVLDMTRELVRYDPDLFLVYMGHNEFYGALGVASTQKISDSRSLINWYLRLEKLRLVQLIRDFVHKFGRAAEKPDGQQTLMQAVVSDNTIPYDSPKYQLAHDYFAENLADILSLIQRSGSHVIVSDLVSNLRDQPPFVSVFQVEGEEKAQWQKFYDAALKYLGQGDGATALQMIKKAGAIDSSAADYWFGLGRCYEMFGDYHRAESAYVKARDLDALRFRASSDLNKIIAAVCRKAGVPLVTMTQIFSDSSIHNIVGNDLMLEHLHPNLKGNYLLADGFLRAMAKNNILSPQRSWPWHLDGSMEENLAQAYVTDFELEIGYHRIRKLTSQWPFKQARVFENHYDAGYKRLLDELVQKAVSGEISWNEGHYKVAEYFFQRGEFARAEREYRAVIKVTPSNYYPWLYLGNTLMAQQKWAETEKAYKTAARLNPSSPFAYAKLGMLFLRHQKAADAAKMFETAIAVDEKSAIFNNSEKGRAYYLYSLALAQQGQYKKAHDLATRAARALPQDKKIYDLLQQLKVLLADDD